VEHVADVKSYIEGRFVIIVGDRWRAEELGVGHATVTVVICLTDSKCNNFESANRIFGTATPREKRREGISRITSTENFSSTA
jgi:hypothetical protein